MTFISDNRSTRKVRPLCLLPAPARVVKVAAL
jgi:hypothetical protein